MQPAPPGGRPFSRRRLLALLGAGLVAGCTPARDVPAAAPPPAPTAAPTASPTPPPTPAAPLASAPEPGPTVAADPSATPAHTPPAHTPWEPLPEEIEPEAKTLAARVVEALTRYTADTDAEALVAAAIERVGAVTGDLDVPQTVDAVVPLWTGGRQSSGVVVYPQLGGLDPAPETGRRPQRCSVMTVIDQYLSDGEARTAEDVTRVRRCVDVRLRIEDGAWRWEGVEDAGGVAVARPPDLSEAAARLIDHPDVDLPDSATWDIFSGIVDEDLIETMLVMADAGSYRVTALKSGHPDTVFARPYTSNHAVGRAVDVWSVNGVPVVAQGARALGAASTGSPAHELVETLLDTTEVTELGSPWDLDGPATANRPRTRSWTNTVHNDHLHVGFDR